MKKIISAGLAGCALVGALGFGGLVLSSGLVNHSASPQSGGLWPGPVEN